MIAGDRTVPYRHTKPLKPTKFILNNTDPQEMSSAIATASSVKAALEELRASGNTPTADNVIKILGGGSKTTVLSHLRRLMKDDAPQAEELPLPLMDRVRPALTELFAAGAAAEAEKIRTRVERQDRLLDEMEHQLLELAEERETLRNQVMSLAVERDSLAVRCGELESDLAGGKAELEATQERLARARDQTAASIAGLLARVEALGTKVASETDYLRLGDA